MQRHLCCGAGKVFIKLLIFIFQFIFREVL